MPEGLVGGGDAAPSGSSAVAACAQRRRNDSSRSRGRGAIDRIASAIRATQATYGRDAVGVFGGGSLTNEKAYLLGKFARVALGTSNVDYNGRFCMSSAAAGASKALGIDRGLPFPLEDIPRAEVILLVGGNMAETMPPIMRYFEAQQRNGGALDRGRSAPVADCAVGEAASARCAPDLMPRWRTGLCIC